MKKKYLFILAGLLFSICSFSQVTVTVTNPTNATPGLAASYTSLANAVTAVNSITAMSGPVILTCAAGAETAPAGGYSINSPGGTSATNKITFTCSGTVTITASPSLTAGSLTDAIFKLVGADYITVSGFTMQENAANTTTAVASNNMTEWGVALLHASTTNGAQNNIIQNNTISLKRAYANSFGIYSNARHSATNVTSTDDITNNTTGPDSYNKIYGNTISDVNLGITFIGSNTPSNMDAGNDIGGAAAGTGNTITNWGGAASTGGFVSDAAASYCIFMGNQLSDNTSYNSITSAAVSGTSASFYGIDKDYSFGSSPTGTFTSTIGNNTITMSSAFTSGIFRAVNSDGITATGIVTLNITNNNIVNCVMSGVSSSTSFTGIYNHAASSVLNASFNTVRGYNSAATSGGFTGIENTGAVVNTITISNNKIGDAVSGAASFSAATTGDIYAIKNASAAATTTLNMNNNTIDGIACVKAGAMAGLFNSGAAGVAINMNNNQLGSVTGTFISFSGAQAGTVNSITNINGTGTTSLMMQGNDIKGILQPVEGSCFIALLNATGDLLSQTISNNTFTGLSLKTTGSVSFISKSGGTMAPGGSWTCTNNSIVSGFTFSSSFLGGVIFLNSTGTSLNGSTMTETGNNFSNVNVTSGGSVTCINNAEGIFPSGGGPSKTISGNIFDNITVNGALFFNGIYANYSGGVTCASNTISNINITGSGGSATAVSFGIANLGTLSCSSNTISAITAGDVTGVLQNTNSATTVDINNNDINGLSAITTNVIGIDVRGGTTVNVYDNLLHNFNIVSVAAIIRGIGLLNTPTTTNIYRNKIYDFTSTGAVGSNTVSGIMVFGGITCNVYDNFISDLKAPNANYAGSAIRGLSVINSTPSSVLNFYYNSIYLNASSAGTNFGTAGVYHVTNATPTTGALNMIDNIIVNTSTPKGTGVTTAYERSNTTLSNYAATSDYNLFYAGLPAASRLIYYDGTNADQTLAAFQARVATRDANDITFMPNFVSNTDLHLTSRNCLIDVKGTPIAGYTTDIDNATRNATTPDMGADEFTAASGIVLAGIVGSVTCDYRTVSVSGTTYTANSCGLVAHVLPSGGSPVSGDINACVTLDATQKYFNGEPYLQRHYDIEPVSANTSTTSATITLYFTDAEFSTFNTNNPTWPKLPTVAGGGSADPNRANLRITQYHGTSTTTPSTPGNYTANAGAGFLINPVDANIVWNGSYWAVTFDITGFSGFYVHTNPTFPLAVSVEYFTGHKQGANHQLNWKVNCNNTASLKMELERSANVNGGFSLINTINATTVQCNQAFGYTDAQPLKGMNYYRLKMTDASGKVSYSGIVALLNADKGMEMVNIVPNPVVSDGRFTLNISAARASQVNLVITDMTGRVVQQQQKTLTAGYNSLPMNVASLAPGTYNITGISDEDKTRILRFVKQ